MPGLDDEDKHEINHEKHSPPPKEPRSLSLTRSKSTKIIIDTNKKIRPDH